MSLLKKKFAWQSSQETNVYYKKSTETTKKRGQFKNYSMKF